MVMEEVAISVGGSRSDVPLFLLGKGATQDPSPYTSEAASMLRRLSASQVMAPPPLVSAKAPPSSKDEKKEDDTKMASV